MGKVYLVGAGPGDPGLITVKGLGLIKKADVIIYDFLINKKLLNFAGKGAKLIYAGKSYKHHSMEQDEINKLLEEKAKKSKVVVRLKNGDPFVFGRGGEEAVYLSKRNIPCEVVPGVSSAIAIPASCGVPLTHRDYASSVAIITGHRKDNTISAATLVFLMAVTNLERIVKNLIKKGKSPGTPCILIERGTFKNQKIVQGNLENIAGRAQKKKISPPAVFVVGKVVDLRGILNKTKKRILFTGTNPERFRHLGEILHAPLIKIAALNDYTKVKKEVKEISKYHWIIFTSRYAVKYFFDPAPACLRKHYCMGGRGGVRICAIGRATANKLKEYGIRVDCVPRKESSQGIVKALRRFNLKSKNILIPRSNLSSNYLPRALRKTGANVKALTVYKNVRPSKVKKIDFNKIDEIIFTSPSTVQNFMAVYKKIPEGIIMKCIGEVTCAKLKSYGFYGEVMNNELSVT